MTSYRILFFYQTNFRNSGAIMAPFQHMTVSGKQWKPPLMKLLGVLKPRH